MSTPLSKSEIAEGYDEIAEKLAMSPKFYRLCASLAAPLLPAQGAVLDIGCGQGWQLAEIRKLRPEARLFGMDISPKLVSLAREHVPGAQVETGDADKLSYPADSFDVVVMTEVLEHLSDPVLALGQIRQVLKSGGWMLITVPNRDWFRYEWYLNNRRRYQPVDDQWYRVAEITGFIQQAGFELKRITGAENLYFGGGVPRLLEKLALKLCPPLQRRMKRALYLARKPLAS
ncbi:class I SAM-dependent methyltransferase [Prosthecobacter vanneervenii]|uniref:SAM-dependent methyltransferase n=1 Tax=Prosthecobacter vanneervenii TaxID=48466 RepID=A0A7W7YFZ9_9BACT|nr:class I SAM-dependent methyltransferase [Prosthecobacter vanneervenii]MBB5035175.1 SAM-dependent methyltransferase [Prosthecobacter vanneervenii]